MSALAQVYNVQGGARRHEESALLRCFATASPTARSFPGRAGGGLADTLAEMAFASHCGLEITLDPRRGSALAQLYSEECGAVLQVATSGLREVWQELAAQDLLDCGRAIGRPLTELRLRFTVGEETLDEPWAELRRAWSETSWQMRRLRDDPDCADEENAAALDSTAPGLRWQLSFDPQRIQAAFISRGARPPIAVLREQGVNSRVEMAAALTRRLRAARRAHERRAGGRQARQGFAV